MWHIAHREANVRPLRLWLQCSRRKDENITEQIEREYVAHTHESKVSSSERGCYAHHANLTAYMLHPYEARASTVRLQK